MSDLAIKYALIYKGEEILLDALSRKCEPQSEAKVTRKKSMGGTIHQTVVKGNVTFPFKWEEKDFTFCQKLLDLFNDYNLSDEPLYLRRRKLDGTEETFEVVMEQPTVKLTLIESHDKRRGSVEMEVTSKRWKSLTF